MSAFTDKELDYLSSQQLGRLATIGSDGQPHVVPVSFRWNAASSRIDIGGHGLDRSKKYRDVGKNPLVALVVDDVLPPWQPRGVEIRGHAAILPSGGKELYPDFSDPLICITPTRVVGWGLDTDPFHPLARNVE